jgi:hypothetical protein
MTDTIINRSADGPPKPPAKVGPFRVIQQAMSSLLDWINELRRDVDAMRTSANSRASRLDLIEAKLRTKPRPTSSEPLRILEIGPPVVSASGATVRELKFGDTTIRVLVDEPAAVPADGGTQ